MFTLRLCLFKKALIRTKSTMPITKILSVALLLLSSNLLANDQIEVTIGANDQHEECFFINVESKISYQFQSSSSLDFNVHFHDDNGMNYLVELPKSKGDKRLLSKLKNKQVYCLMWVNSSETNTELSYQFTLDK